VVARWKMEATHTGSLMGETPTGKRVSSRGLTYYRLVDGQIVEDDRLRRPTCCSARHPGASTAWRIDRFRPYRLFVSNHEQPIYLSS